MTLILVPADFEGDFGAPSSEPERPGHLGVLALQWTGHVDLATDAAAEAYFLTHMHLVSLETSSAVPGHAVSGMVRPSGEVAEDFNFPGGAGAFSFIPDSPLTDGWYVLVVDAHDWVSARGFVQFSDQGRVEAQTIYGRFQVGRRLDWVAAYNSCTDVGDRPGCVFGALLSVPGVVTDIATSRFELRVNGAVDPLCSEIVQESGWSWECPNYPDGTAIQIQLVTEGGVHALRDDLRIQVLTTPFAHPVTLIDPGFGIDIAREAL